MSKIFNIPDLIKEITTFCKKISVDCWAVCCYLLFMPYTIVSTPFGSMLKVVTIPVVAVLIIKLLFGENKPIRFNCVQLLYIIYILYTVWELTLLCFDTSLVQTKDMVLTCSAIILMTMRVYTEDEKKMMENTWIVVGLISLFFGLFRTRNISEFESRAAVFILGCYEDPNQFCGYFIMPIMIIIKRIVNKSKLIPLYVVIFLLIMYAVLKTGSRGGLIGILMGILVYIMIGIKSFKKKVALVVCGLLSAVFIVGIVFPLLPQDVQDRYSVESVAEDKGSGRFIIWNYLLTYTFEKPERIVHGGGLYSTVPVLKAANVTGTATGAHNQFVQVFADQGIIGLGLFLSFAAVCFFRSIRMNPEYGCAFMAVMALALSLSFYVFKPYINIIIMCTMSFDKTTIKK